MGRGIVVLSQLLRAGVSFASQMGNVRQEPFNEQGNSMAGKIRAFQGVAGLIACFWLCQNAMAGEGAPPLAASRLEFVDVFVVAEEQVKGLNGSDYAWFREQNVIVTDSGRVVVVCQGRNGSSWSDRSGQDLVCKWSTDNGHTWSPASFVARHGEKSICPNAAVYDKTSGRIIVLYNLFLWPFSDAASRKTFPDPKSKQYLVYSDDEGRTWSAPRDISKMMRTDRAPIVFGSGEGIVLRHGPHRGRLIVPGGDFENHKKVYAFYSDDHGLTWNYSLPVPRPKGCNLQCETSMAELPGGTIILNNRNNQSQLRRRAHSADGGVTWTPMENDPQLPSVGCNGSIIHVPDEPHGQKGLLLYSGPVGPGRTHGAVFVSLDLGKTWPIRKLIEPGGFAYSSLARLADGKIGLFYETDNYTKIRMARLPLQWLVGKETPVRN